MKNTKLLFSFAVTAALLTASTAAAQDAVAPGELRVDRPTVQSLGVQLLISGDDDLDATAELFVRPAGAGAWRAGLPMLRVLPDTVVGLDVPHQIAGSAVDLEPATDYEIEVRVTDPDGGDKVLTAVATTRGVPAREPATPRTVAVASGDELRAALQAAAPGDVITVAAGTYTGSFSLNASGTAQDPIVIRGADRDTVIVDGEGCNCNVFEVYGSFTHLENLTIRNAVRAVRFLGDGATNNVARDLLIEDVVHGIGSQSGQRDFYLCDNVVHGRLQWPLVSSDDGAQHNDDQGIRVDGDGHVVCHNEISGFGDPILNFAEGYRALDVYGNEVFDIYGDGIEIDRAAGNARVFRNRWTNVYTAISMQPIHGGPAYVFRNVVVNVADEQVKLKSLGGDQEPSGALIFHNTFVSPESALNLQTPIAQHNFRIANNLFIGPAQTARGYTVDWTAQIDRGSFDFNGYYPDGRFWFGKDAQGNNQVWDSFAQVQAGGVYEQNGRLVEASPFANGLVPPPDYTTSVPPQDVTLSNASAAIDAAVAIPGVNDGFEGVAPDLGALEFGCRSPAFGPRVEMDERDFVPLCEPTTPEPGTDADAGGTPEELDGGIPATPEGSGDAGANAPDAGDGATGGGTAIDHDGADGGGCSCSSARGGSQAAGWLLLAALAFGIARLRRRRARVAAALVSLFALVGCNACSDPLLGVGTDIGSSDSGASDTSEMPGDDAGGSLDSSSTSPDACANACSAACCAVGEDCVDGACVAACADGPRCETEAGSVCCGAEQGCAFQKCVELGPTCDEQTPCPFTHFCEPTLGRCIDFAEDPNACLFVPPIGEFTPVEAFKWESSPNAPTYDQVMMMPVVGNLTDDNGDGAIDTNDIPDIVFTTFAGGAYNDPGVLRVISGDGSGEHWSSTTLTAPFDVFGSASPALGDIDGDGVAELVIGGGSAGGVYAVENDGTIKWHQPAAVGPGYGGPAIANLDGAGAPEILVRGQVLSADGAIVCQLATGSTTPLAADLDLDGQQEIVMGTAIYKLDNPAATDGTGCTEVRAGASSFPAVANFDADPQPELVHAYDGRLILVDHDGTELWNIPLPVDGPRIQALFGVTDCAAAGKACTTDAECGGTSCAAGTCTEHRHCRPGGGPPTIADFDGDRQPEIAIAGRWYYLVFEADGTVLWAHKTQDFSSAVTGSSVFDFEGDGRAEVVYNDEKFLRVYRGAGTGSDGDGDGYDDAEILLEVPNTSGTLAEYPLIVDVDNDGSAEIVVAANNYGGQEGPTHGIRVFKDAQNRWVGTRPIWNQHTYHVTNVEPDGTIPLTEIDNWSVAWLNNYRQNSQGGNPFTAPNLTAMVDTVDATACTTNGVDIGFTIRNQGSLGVRIGALNATLYVAPAGQDAFTPLVTVQNTLPLAPGASEAFMYHWTPPAEFAGQRFDVKVVADDDGTMTGAHNECIEDDNEGRLDNTLCSVPQ